MLATPITRLSEPVNHGVDGAYLRAALAREVFAGESPPVPAALRVGPRHRDPSDPAGHRGRLRIEHDNVVRLGPLVVTRVADECLADGVRVLQAAVKGDVQPAASMLGAAL